MKTSRQNAGRHGGFSLIETVIALGMLAVSVPLVFLALEVGGRGAMASATDSCGGRMVDVCLEEIRASREGRAQWFSNTRLGAVIPPKGETWAFAFSNEGRVIDRITTKQWTSGVNRLNDEPVRYLAKIDSTAYLSSGLPDLRRIRITVEEPAAATDDKRAKSEFYTLVP